MNHDENQLQQPVFDRRSPMPCADHGQRIALTERSVVSIERTMEAVSTKMDILIGTMTKVALLEEKHGNQQQDVTRAHAKIEHNAEKLDKLAEESRAFMNFQKGRDKVLLGIIGAVAGLFVKIIFFSASHGMTP